MFAIWLALLVAILVLGSLAAVVWGIVYAIVNKRPSVAVASVLVPIAVVFGGALLVALLRTRAHWFSRRCSQYKSAGREALRCRRCRPCRRCLPRRT